MIVNGTVTGDSVNGNIWGTDIYTDDSYLWRAAIHMGFLTNGELGTVACLVTNGLSSYAVPHVLASPRPVLARGPEVMHRCFWCPHSPPAGASGRVQRRHGGGAERGVLQKHLRLSMVSQRRIDARRNWRDVDHSQCECRRERFVCRAGAHGQRHQRQRIRPTCGAAQRHEYGRGDESCKRIRSSREAPARFITSRSPAIPTPAAFGARASTRAIRICHARQFRRDPRLDNLEIFLWSYCPVNLLISAAHETESPAWTTGLGPGRLPSSASRVYSDRFARI